MSCLNTDILFTFFQYVLSCLYSLHAIALMMFRSWDLRDLMVEKCSGLGNLPVTLPGWGDEFEPKGFSLSSRIQALYL